MSKQTRSLRKGSKALEENRPTSHLQRRHVAVEHGNKSNSNDTKAPQFLSGDVSKLDYFDHFQQVDEKRAAP